MPRAGFYNDNEYRAYPFIYKKTEPNPALPAACIVDCGIIMGLDSQYDETIHTVWLSTIHRAVAHFEFELVTNAPGAADKPLIFTRAPTVAEWTTEQRESDTADNKECATEPAWEGFLVTGVLDELTANMPVGATRVFSSTDYVLEPARIQSLVKTYLRSISLGNYSRIVAYPPEECGGPAEPPPRHVVVNKKCMNGNLKFKEGYNCQIFQVDRNNEIIVAAAVGAGIRDTELCAEIKLFEEETPPDGSKFLSGGPACDEIVFTVNGLNAAGTLQIIGGNGVTIKQDPTNEHGIIIERVDNLLVSGCQG